MAAYMIFDVEIRDMSRYQEFMAGVKPALEAAEPDTWRAEARTPYMRATGSRGGSCCLSFPRQRRRTTSTTARHTVA
jgi:hypothetical protein